MGTGKRKTRIVKILSMASCGVLALSGRAQASHIEYGVGYDGVFTNNIYRSATNRHREYINMFRGLLAYHKHGRRLDTHLDLEAIGRVFTLGTYRNDVLFGVNSLTHYIVLPKVLSLSERDIFTQAPIDPRFVMEPTNLQNTNALSIGPNLSWYVDPIDAFQARLRYQNFYYQNLPSTFPKTFSTSNYRWLARLRFVHAFSRYTKASVNYVPSKVIFRNTLINPDYRREDAYIGFGTRLGHLSLTADGGRTRIEEAGGLGHLSGVLARIALTDTIGPRSRLTLAGDRSFGDAGRYALQEAPAPNLVLPVATNPQESIGGGLYYGRTASLSYTYRRVTGADRISAFWEHLHYFTLPLSQRLAGGIFNVGYDLSNRVSDSIFGDYVRIHYVSYNANTRYFGAGTRLRYRLTRRLSVSLEGMYDRGLSRDPVLAYSEWRAIVGISYLTNPYRMRTDPFVHYTNAMFY